MKKIVQVFLFSVTTPPPPHVPRFDTTQVKCRLMSIRDKLLILGARNLLWLLKLIFINSSSACPIYIPVIIFHFILQNWFDHRLAWKRENYGNISYMVTPFEDVWAPPLVIENA